MKNDIEELRRRAKDNKAKIAEYYLTLGFDSIKDLRGVLFALPAIAFGYIQSGLGKTPNYNYFKISFLISFISGIISYILSLVAFLKQSTFYSAREKILSDGFPTLNQYNKMIKLENKLIANHTNYWFNASFLTILIQTLFSIITLCLL